MTTMFKKVSRDVRNPLYGKQVPKSLSGKETRELKKLGSRKKLRTPAPTAEILPLQGKLRPILKHGWPDRTAKDIGWTTADLAGLWEVSRMHIILVRKLLRMGRKPDRNKLRQILLDLEINWFSNAEGHMHTLKHELARLRRELAD
jgi:hypothetical protein